VHYSGNFYGGHVAQAMDSLKTAVASVGDLLDRQLQLIVDEKFNRGLTPNLIAIQRADDPRLGLHHGFKGMQIACSALAAEALKCTMPASAFSRSTEAHNQDKVSMGSIAARDARTVTDLVRDITAIHLIALAQAADLRGSNLLSPATLAAHRLIRSVSPFVGADRRLDGDITAVAALVSSGRLRAHCENAMPTQTEE
jgi:histidine ammonia-lyase